MRCRNVAALIWIMVLAFTLRAFGAAVSLEHPIKATFVYKFAPFVEWPQNAFASPTSPISICALGEDAVTALLDQAVAGQTAGARRFEVRHLDRVARNSGCHILYIAGSSAQSPSDALNAVQGSPVLTVTDAARTPQAAGAISFFVQDSRVRFDIDQAAAAENGLSISSRLLSLARRVRVRP